MSDTSALYGSFSLRIDATFLTKHVRQLVMEDKWEEALRLLMEDLEGMNYDYAISILRGENRFEQSQEGFIMHAEDIDATEEYISDLEDVFAGRWYDHERKGTYLPYASVISFGAQDMPLMEDGRNWVPSFVSGSEGLKDEFSKARTVYYADKPEEDKVEILYLGDTRTPILFRRVANVPTWMKRVTDPQEALERFLDSGRELDIRGAQEGRGTGRGLNAVVNGGYSEEEFDTLEGDKGFWHDILPEGLDDDVREGIVQRFSSLGEDKQLVEDTSLQGEYGAILPDGRFFACTFMGHADLFQDILNEIYGVEGDFRSIDAEIEMEKRNVVRIARNAVKRKTEILFGGITLTKRQLDTIAMWCEKHKHPIPSDLFEQGTRKRIA